MTITNDDLLKEISDIELGELSDLNHSGELQQTVVNDAIDDALSFIESFFSLPTSPTPLLSKIAVDLAIFELRRKNGIVTDEMKEDRKQNESYLFKMGRNLLPKETTQNPQTVEESFTSFKHREKRIDMDGYL